MSQISRTARALLYALLLPLSAEASDNDSVSIATASPDGVYHIVGRAICRAVDFPCLAEPSDGSIANLDNVRHGAATLALAQSDSQHFAVYGTEAFRDAGPDSELRSVFSLHSEPFTLVVRRDAGIQSLDDMPRHSVNIGNPGSGQHGTMLRLMQTRGWRHSDFRLVNELPADQQSMELCHGNIDAMVYTVGHPNASVAQAIRLCNAALIDVTGEAVDRLVEETPYFTRAWIAGGLYGPDQPAVRTFGVRATLVTSAQADPEMIYRLVSGVFHDLLRFKAAHPALGMLTAQEMIHDGLSAPLHEGALRYYREQGWLPKSGTAKGPTEGETRLASLSHAAGD